MKKLLALVLALVMTIGLATVSANAATTYSDANSINYKEAADVMSAVGVFDGMDGNAFNPTGSLTREQGAKIITYMLLGKTAADALGASSAPFTDVAMDRWSAGSIQYCAANGIVGGRGDGTFDPAGELTGYAFGKMLLVALGYSAEVEGLGGADWQVNVAKLIQRTGLADSIASFVGSNTVTREAAAQMALNALKADMVEYTGGVTVSGAQNTQVTVNSTRTVVTTTSAWGDAIDPDLDGTGRDIVQLGEYLYKGDLKLKDATDEFGRPGAYVWTYKADSVSEQVADDEDLVTTWNKKVTYGDLYNAMGSTMLGKTLSFKIYSDGLEVVNMTRANTSTAWGNAAIQTAAEGSKNGFDFGNLTKGSNVKIGYEDGEATYANIVDAMFPTGTGTRTELYATYNDTNDTYAVRLVTIHTYVAKATADYNTSKESLSITPLVPTATATIPAVATTLANAGTVYSEDFGGLTGIKKDDVLIYTAAHTTGATYEVKSIQPAKKVENLTASAFTDSSATLGGTTYSFVNTKTDANTYNLFTAASVKAGTTYNIWTDNDGNMVYAEGTAINDYLYIPTGKVDNAGNALGADIVATAIFADGTKKTIHVSKVGTVDATAINVGTENASDGAWWKYTVDSNDKYTLYAVTNVQIPANTEYSAKKANLNTGAIADSKTVFVVYNSNTKAYSVYTGIANLPTVDTTAAGSPTYSAAVNASGYATFVYLAASDSNIKTSTSRNTAFIDAGSESTGYDADAKSNTYTYDALINGAPDKITVKDQVLLSGLYTWTNTSDGYPASLTRVETNDTTARDYVLTENGATLAYNNGTLNDGTNYLVLTDDANIWLIDDAKDRVEKTSASAIVQEFGTFNGYVTVSTVSSTDRKVTDLYFQVATGTLTDVATLLVAKVTVAGNGDPSTGKITATTQQTDGTEVTYAAVNATGYTVTYTWYSDDDGTDDATHTHTMVPGTTAGVTQTATNPLEITVTTTYAYDDEAGNGAYYGCTVSITDTYGRNVTVKDYTDTAFDTTKT